MFSTTIDFNQAEIAYRQERIRRDFRRTGWFEPQPAAAPAGTAAPDRAARHAA